MNTRFSRLITNFKGWWSRQSTRRKVLLGIIIAVVVILFLRKGGTAGDATIETVKRQNLVRSISASGSVVSSTDLSLGFEQSKMISSIKVSVGSKVKKGDVLANLSNGTERAAVASAKGSLLAARARYNKVLEGSSSQEVKLAQVQLENARRQYLSQGLVAKSDDPQNADSSITPTISGTYTGSEGVYRIELDTFSQNKLSYSGIERGFTKADDITPQPLGTKGLYIQFPSGSRSRFANAVWTITIPNLESSVAIANKAAVAEKEAQLDLTRASAQQPDVDAALADMVTAQAAVDSANATLEKTILRAPADGTITAVNVKVGEIPELGKVAIALQDISNLYLEANINESNIKSVAIGQPVLVTYDAFTGDTYTATVSSIDPAATIENNVVNYKIKALVTDTENIRPGMTANMVVQTARIDNALVLPGRVIDTKDGRSVVNRITDEDTQKTIAQEVTIGLRGDGDLVEIQSGLGEGDKVLMTPPTK